jgi:hypothetical protein
MTYMDPPSWGPHRAPPPQVEAAPHDIVMEEGPTSIEKEGATSAGEEGPPDGDMIPDLPLGSR